MNVNPKNRNEKRLGKRPISGKGRRRADKKKRIPKNREPRGYGRVNYRHSHPEATFMMSTIERILRNHGKRERRYFGVKI